MKFLRNLLGIGTLEEKLEEVYQHCVRANSHTHSSLFEQKDMLQVLIDSEAEKTFKPQIWSSFGQKAMPVAKKSQKTTGGDYAYGSRCTLEQEDTQFQAIISFLQSREKASVDQIYHAVKNNIRTRNKRGKRSAVWSSLGKLLCHGFVKKPGYGVYQINEEKKGLLSVIRQKAFKKDEKNKH